ncbi:MAG: hypothetical protein R3C01_12675 [Planctomycetaceae bacterium]
MADLDDLKYCTDTQTIHGVVSGSNPPDMLFAYVWNDGSSPPTEIPQHTTGISWKHSGNDIGPFSIHDANWPTSGPLNCLVWQVAFAATPETVEDIGPCSGSGSGGGGGGGEPVLVAYSVIDTAAQSYTADVKGFEKGPMASWNGDWPLAFDAQHYPGLKWSSEPSGTAGPDISLSLEGLYGASVKLVLQCGDSQLEYQLPTNEWQPLGVNEMFLASETPLPGVPASVKVRAA